MNVFLCVILGVSPILLWGSPDYFIMIISSFTMRCLGYVYLCVSANVFCIYCTSGLQWFLKSWLDIAFFSFGKSSAIICPNISCALLSLSSFSGSFFSYILSVFLFLSPEAILLGIPHNPFFDCIYLYCQEMFCGIYCLF